MAKPRTSKVRFFSGNVLADFLGNQMADAMEVIGVANL
jgi:hypothetical protein